MSPPQPGTWRREEGVVSHRLLWRRVLVASQHVHLLIAHDKLH